MFSIWKKPNGLTNYGKSRLMSQCHSSCKVHVFKLVDYKDKDKNFLWCVLNNMHLALVDSIFKLTSIDTANNNTTSSAADPDFAYG